MRFKQAIMFVFGLFAAQIACSANLLLTIGNIQSVSGDIRVAVYQVLEHSNWQDEPILLLSFSESNINRHQLKETLSLAEGDYAIRLFQDVNGNQQLDYDANGLPLEPFAFSGEVELGIPFLRDAKFSVKEEQTVLSIDLINPQRISTKLDKQQSNDNN